MLQRSLNLAASGVRALLDAPSFVARTITGGSGARSEAARKAAATRRRDAARRSDAARRAAATRQAGAKARSSASKRAARTRAQRDQRVDAMVDATREHD